MSDLSTIITINYNGINCDASLFILDYLEKIINCQDFKKKLELSQVKLSVFYIIKILTDYVTKENIHYELIYSYVNNVGEGVFTIDEKSTNKNYKSTLKVNKNYNDYVVNIYGEYFNVKKDCMANLTMIED